MPTTPRSLKTLTTSPSLISRAAASLGISVFGAKLYAFAVGAAIAAFAVVPFGASTTLFGLLEPYRIDIVRGDGSLVAAMTGTTFIDQTPMKRLGTAEEVAATIAFLCSSDASFITAASLHVNGGLYISS